MKLQQFIGVFLAAGLAGEAVASCGDPQLPADDITALLEGHTVCVSNGNGGWTFQEQHIAGGLLRDHKRGGNDFDPTQDVGQWSIAPRADEVRYTYGGSSTQYEVRGTGNPEIINQADLWTFCGPDTIEFTVRDSITGCD